MKLLALPCSVLFILFAFIWIVPIESASLLGQERPATKQLPTPIQVGVMTARQKEHSKLYGTYHTGRNFDVPPPEHILETRAEDGVYIETPLEAFNPDGPKISFEDFLGEVSCQADAILTASPNHEASQLTENRQFIFTDYDLVVKEVFKNNSAAMLQNGGEITVTRPGGRVLINGRVASAFDSSYQPLEMGQQHLLFLKYIPQTGAYEGLPKGAFLIKETSLIPLTEQFIPTDANGARLLTSEVQTILRSGCDGQPRIADVFQILGTGVGALGCIDDHLEPAVIPKLLIHFAALRPGRLESLALPG